jgi:hypothetical protein
LAGAYFASGLYLNFFAFRIARANPIYALRYE